MPSPRRRLPSGPGAAAVLAVLAVCWLPAGHLAAELEVPFLSGRVNDLADLFPAGGEERIDAALRALETESGAQMAVLTVPSLEGEPIEDFSLRVAETWKLGAAERDDGVLLVVARDERRMRLEVGYGLEPLLTDATSGRILDGILQPAFRRGDFVGGTERGVAAVGDALAGREVQPARGEEPRGAAGSGDQIVPGLVVFAVMGFLCLEVLFSGKTPSLVYFFVLAPLTYFFVLAFVAGLAGHLLGVSWSALYLLLRYYVWHTDAGRRERQRWAERKQSSGGGSWWGGSSGGFSGGGFSGGFSGGGGSFGGGGASSSW